MSTQTINIWEGNGSTNAFSFSFDNYDPDFVTLEGYVKDLTGTIDLSYTWSFDPLITNQVVLKDTTTGLDKNLAAGYTFTLEIDVDETLPVWYNANSIDINDDTLNTSNISLMNNIQAVKDHRTNLRIRSEDMNNQHIINVAPGVQDGDAVNVSQLNSAVGDIDELVQRAEDAADESELYRDESLAASVDSANSAAAALVSEQDAEAAALIANTMYKGEWETDYPNGTDTGYSIGDTVLYGSNQYKSLVNNNTSVPTSTLGTEWLFYLPGAVGSAEQTASFFQTYLQGDGVETEFDLTALNPTWTPKISDNVFLVLINNEPSLDWTIVINQDGHSILKFLTAPEESNDTVKNNIFVVGGSPKISDLPNDPDSYLVTGPNGEYASLSIQEARPKDYINDTIYYGGEFDASQQYIFGNGSDGTTVPTYTYSSYSYDLTNTALRSKSFVVVPTNTSTFKMRVKFSPDTITGVPALFGQGDRTAEEISCQINPDGKLQLFLSSNGTSWDIANANVLDFVLQVGGKYVADLEKTATDYIWTLYDSDGTTVLTQNVINNSNSVFQFNYFVGYSNHGTDRYFNGKIYLDDTSVVVEGNEVLRRQDTAYIENSIAWKGSVRSEDNLTTISSMDYVRSTPIFNANSQYTTVGNPYYDYPSYTYQLNGASTFVYKKDVTGFNASDFDFQVKMNARNVALCPIGGVGQTVGNLGFSLKIINGTLNLWLSSSGAAWDISNASIGAHTYAINTEYIVRLYRDANNWYVDYSTTNGAVWINDITVNSSVDMFNQVMDVFVSADSTVNPDIVMDGTLYLDETSLFLNGEYVIKAQDPSESSQPYEESYYFVGYDNSDVLKIERTSNEDGSGLPTITGAKRRLGDNKDVVFPTDGSGDLAYFTRKFETWEFTLWEGISQLVVNNAYILNNSYKNYEYLQGLFQESNQSSYPGEIIRRSHLDERARTRLYNTEVNFVSSTFTDTGFTVNQVASTNISVIKFIGVK